MLEKELMNLGLSQKAAKVYLAALELGQTTVQKISEKAGVNRATTYFVLESIMNLGLISTIDKGKKTYFTAEPPEKLINLLKKQEAEIVQKAKNFETILPELKSIYNVASDKPRVRFYEGRDALWVLREDLLDSAPGQTVQDISFEGNIDDVLVTEEDRREYVQKLKEKGISSVAIVTDEQGEKYRRVKVKEVDSLKFVIPKNTFPISSDITIYGSKVSMISPRKKFASIIIEDHDIAKTLRSIFYLALEGIKKLSYDAQGGMVQEIEESSDKGAKARS